MHLRDLVGRDPVPTPWAEGEKIPWDDPEFSKRMLREHLTDCHDAASRRSSIIDRHVEWIHSTVLQGSPGRVLDLGCGPGLYANRLASLGHQCVGIDFGPASIAYAEEQAGAGNLNCSFVLDDVRRADFGSGYGLVMMIFGEFNVFHPDDAKLILRKSREALNDGGLLLLEVQTIDAVRANGATPPKWRTLENGLFSPRPHLLLEEAFWDDAQQVATRRYFVVDAETSQVDRYAESAQAYTLATYEKMLATAGFTVRERFGALDGSADTGEFEVYLAAAE